MAGNPVFGRRVRDIREAKVKTDPRFTLRSFAKAVGISPTFLSKVERGEFDPPRPEKIIKMAEVLGIDADELLALANKVDPKLSRIIMDEPKAMADFLRTARDKKLTAEDIQKLTEKIRKQVRS